MAKSNYTTDDMIRHYNCGDLNEALFNEDSTTVSNYLYYNYNYNEFFKQ